MSGDQHITLYRPVQYRITILGHLSEHSHLLESIRFTVHEYGCETTTLIGTVDQAELHGTLRGLYNMGLPLISVFCDSHQPKE